MLLKMNYLKKLKAIDTSSFVLKTKLASDVTTLENKIDTVDKINTRYKWISY